MSLESVISPADLAELNKTGRTITNGTNLAYEDAVEAAEWFAERAATAANGSWWEVEPEAELFMKRFLGDINAHGVDLTREFKNAIFDTLRANGVPVKEAARAAGIGQKTGYRREEKLSGDNLSSSEKREAIRAELGELSDQRIVDKLAQRGISVSRPTVTKTRREANIAQPDEKPWRHAQGEPDEQQRANWRSTFETFKSYTDTLTAGLTGTDRADMLEYLKSTIARMENNHA